jgi:hypothetical protein
MLIQPRDQILDIWRAVIAYAYRDSKWQWAGRGEPNSISDAELLLCILYPATNVPPLRLDRPDQTARDVLDALHGLGNDQEVIRVIIRVLTDYMERYSSEGRPFFSGGSYLDHLPGHDDTDPTPTAEQQNLEIVDSFSMSVTLSLSTLGFLQVLRAAVRNEKTLAQIDRLKDLASQRLTGAMTGLLRSFSVRVFDYNSDPGRNLLSMVNQRHEPDEIVGERLSARLGDIRSRLRDELSIGSGRGADELDNSSSLFECGWSWGVVRGAETIRYTEAVTTQPPGVAEDRPYLYFTGVALDGIEDLFSSRTRILGLLDETQQRLATALQLRWELCLQFWNRVATFDEQHWPVTDVPWRTTDGIESDYYSLFIGSMVAQHNASREGGASAKSLVRVGDLLRDLANRGRITQRPLENDPALASHSPGIRMSLNGSEQLGPQLWWTVSSYASLLLKRVVRISSLVADSVERDRLTLLADQVWEHMLKRRMADGPGEGLWDQPANAFSLDLPVQDQPSWYHTQRVVECLVAAAWAMDVPSPVSAPLVAQAREYLLEAEHLFDQERLYGRQTSGPSIRAAFHSVEANLARARDLQETRPGTACVLAEQVLLDLDKLNRARTRQER